MAEKKIPFTKEQAERWAETYPTPFHIYDEEAIVANIRRFIAAFSWAKDFKNYFAVKATPNPHIMRIMKREGVGGDCSSLAELVICERTGITGKDIMFTSNETPFDEFKKAMELGAIINLDDITHLAYIEEHNGSLPDTLCARYNPGALKQGGNTIIGIPEEAKYGMTREQIFETFRQAKEKGVKHFGLHTMVVSNELDIAGLVGTAELMFDMALDIRKETGIELEFIDLGGGVGIPYRPESEPVDFEALSAGIRKAYERILTANGHPDVQLMFECGRMVTGPYGYLVTRAIHRKDIYKHYIGLDACMANLMRPALYGSYHHITVLGKEHAPATHTYDIVGSLCENNDKFAIDRALPEIGIGDLLVIHDAGAHGHSMGFNYNGKLRSAELLLHGDGSVTRIRRAETLDDLFATLEF